MLTFSRSRVPGASLLLLVLLLSLLPAAPAQADRSVVCADAVTGAFDDVLPSNVHRDNIDCIAALRITRGFGDGRYGPGDDVRRGQMASFLVDLVRVATQTELQPPVGGLPFTDTSGSVHAANIAIASSLRITRGRTATTYEPGTDVNRGQMATFIVNTIAATGIQLPGGSASVFPDVPGTYHAERIGAIAAANIVRGFEDGTYRPHAPVSRAQMASYLVNTAIYLHENGAWMPSQVDGNGPGLELVSRADEASDDVLELRWDRDSEVAGDITDVEVLPSPGAAAIATGSRVLAPDEAHPDRTLVQLDAALQPGSLYWLQVPEGFVHDGDERANTAGLQAFVFVVAAEHLDQDPEDVGSGDPDAPGGDEGSGGDGGSGGDDGSGGDEGSGGDDDGSGSEPAPDDPVVLSVVTEPSQSRIVVTFSESVTCPSTAAALSSWSFRNDSVIESGGDQAQGSPDSVIGLGTSRPSACGLVYDVGIEDGDFGVLDHVQPTNADDRVVSDAGGTLASVSGATVADGVGPLLIGVSAVAGSPSEVVPLFSEPILCSSVGSSSFEVFVNGEQSSDDMISLSCVLATEQPRIFLAASAFSMGDTVQVAVAGTITSQSGVHEVPLGSILSTTATG